MTPAFLTWTTRGVRFLEQKQYEAHEAALLAAQLREVECAPLANRHDARTEYAVACTVPGLVAERVGWLLAGSYGYGAYARAWEIAENTRCNREAGLALLVAAVEWQCPNAYARKSYWGLMPGRQAGITGEIARVMMAALAEREAETRA